MKNKKPRRESKNSVVFKFVKRTLSLSSAEIAKRLNVSRSEVDGWSRNIRATKKTKEDKQKRLYRKISNYNFHKFMSNLTQEEIRKVREKSGQ